MTNLLKETIQDIENSQHKPNDIVFIGIEESGESCTWDEFKLLADNEYDSGYGGSEVRDKLVIVFSDGFKMWRSEYDGSEWWEYLKPSNRSVDEEKIVSLFTFYHNNYNENIERIIKITRNKTI